MCLGLGPSPCTSLPCDRLLVPLLREGPVAVVADADQLGELEGGAVLDPVGDELGQRVQDHPAVLDAGHPKHAGHDAEQGLDLGELRREKERRLEMESSWTRIRSRQFAT